MRTECPVQGTLLITALQAAGNELINVDFCSRFTIVASGGRLGQVLSYSCGTNGFSRQPANALEGENWVVAVGEGFVLRFVSMEREHVVDYWSVPGAISLGGS